MLLSEGIEIEQEVMKILLSAHKRIADSGSTAELIRLTKYILKLAEKRKDILVKEV